MKSEQKRHKTFEEVHKAFQTLSDAEHQKRAKALVKAWMKRYGRK